MVFVCLCREGTKQVTHTYVFPNKKVKDVWINTLRYNKLKLSKLVLDRIHLGIIFQAIIINTSVLRIIVLITFLILLLTDFVTSNFNNVIYQKSLKVID